MCDWDINAAAGVHKDQVYWVRIAALINYHKLSSLNNTNVLSYSSVG